VPSYNDRAYRRARHEVLEAAGFRCQIGGPRCTVWASTVDHVVALVDGGRHDRANLRAACTACNSGAGAALMNRTKAARVIGRRSRRW
jgi:5-methylcytosine-specific restriction endonuclease McrA